MLENHGGKSLDGIRHRSHGRFIQIAEHDAVSTQDRPRRFGDGETPLPAGGTGRRATDNFGIDIAFERFAGLVETLHGDQPARNADLRRGDSDTFVGSIPHGEQHALLQPAEIFRLQLLSPQRRGLPPQKQRIGTVADPAQAHDRPALRGNHFTFLIGESLGNRTGGEQAGAGYNESLHIGMILFPAKIRKYIHRTAAHPFGLKKSLFQFRQLSYICRHERRSEIPEGRACRCGAHHGDHPTGAGPDAGAGEPAMAGRLPRTGRHRQRHSARVRVCVREVRHGAGTRSCRNAAEVRQREGIRRRDRIRGGGFRRRTGLRGNRRGVADRGRLRRPAPAGGGRRGEGPRRGGGVHAPHRSAGPRTGRRQFQGGHQFRQPLHAADARTTGIRLLRQNRLRKRRKAGFRETLRSISERTGLKTGSICVKSGMRRNVPEQIRRRNLIIVT